MMGLTLLLLLASLAHAQCVVDPDDWVRIQTTIAHSSNYVVNFTAQGDCSSDPSSTGLWNTHLNCPQFLTNLVDNATELLTAAMQQSFPLMSVTDLGKTAKYLTSSVKLTDFIQTGLCGYNSYPTCPQSNNLGSFTGVQTCLKGNTQLEGKTRQEYFDSHSDVAGCTTKLSQGSFCIQFASSKTCPATFAQVFNYAYSDHVTYACEAMVAGASDIPTRCNRTWADSYAYYCPPSAKLEDILPLAIGIPAAALVLCLGLAYAWWHQSQLISHKEVLSDLENLQGSMGKIVYHPELAAVVAQTSKYRGLQFDVNSSMWICVGTGQRFPTEKEAARAAYLFSVKPASPRVHMTKQASDLSTMTSSSAASSPNLGKVANSSPNLAVRNETAEERHTRQLIEFYEYWDADKADIPGHVDNLFKRHNFVNVSRAVMTKFGVLPPGWEEELAGV